MLDFWVTMCGVVHVVAALFTALAVLKTVVSVLFSALRNVSSFEIRYEMWNFEAYLFTAVISVVTGFTFGMLGSPVEYPIWTVTVSAAIFGLILVILIAIYGGRWIPAMEKREAEEKKKRE